MKTTTFRLTGIMIFLLTSMLIGCDSYGPAPLPKGFSTQILNIIPQEKIDSLSALGIKIYDGFNPPDIEGIYLISPFVLTIPYGPDDNLSVGYQFSDYKYRFYDFDPDSLKVKVDTKNVNGGDVSTGVAGFLSGNGEGFTMFAELKGISSGISNSQVAIISGRFVGSGIENFQYAFYIKEKDEAPGAGTLIPLGTGRVVVDGDSISEQVSTWRLGLDPTPQSTTSITEIR